MRGPRQVKLEFLKRWAKGLQIYRNRKKNMSLLERKNAIKLSADVAMASTKLKASQWSRALISEASSSNNNTSIVVQHILGSDNSDNVEYHMKKLPIESSSTMCIVGQNKKIIRSKKIFRKSCALARARKSVNPPIAMAATIAKRIVMRRTQMLKSLVPGGKSMDDVSIIKEALDYILSLKVQVNMMRRIVEISELA